MLFEKKSNYHFKADNEITNMLHFFRKAMTTPKQDDSLENRNLCEKLKDSMLNCCKKKDTEEALFSDLAETRACKLMCVEAATALDLCELYPKTGMRLKWLAVKRRKNLEDLIDRKKNITKTVMPVDYKDKVYIDDPTKLDRMFEKYSQRNHCEYEFDVEDLKAHEVSSIAT